MLPQLNEKSFRLIKDNKTLSLIVLLIVCCIYLVMHCFGQYEKQHEEEMKHIEQQREVIKIYREASMRAAEVEKISRLLHSADN